MRRGGALLRSTSSSRTPVGRTETSGWRGRQPRLCGLKRMPRSTAAGGGRVGAQGPAGWPDMRLGFGATCRNSPDIPYFRHAESRGEGGFDHLGC